MTAPRPRGRRVVAAAVLGLVASVMHILALRFLVSILGLAYVAADHPRSPRSREREAIGKSGT